MQMLCSFSLFSRLIISILLPLSFIGDNDSSVFPYHILSWEFWRFSISAYLASSYRRRSYRWCLLPLYFHYGPYGLLLLQNNISHIFDRHCLRFRFMPLSHQGTLLPLSRRCFSAPWFLHTDIDSATKSTLFSHGDIFIIIWPIRRTMPWLILLIILLLIGLLWGGHRHMSTRRWLQPISHAVKYRAFPRSFALKFGLTSRA